MATFSINTNTSTKTDNIDLTTNLEDVLLSLKDNTNKEIFPESLRDALFSAYNSSSFKLTTASGSISYIGVDSGNPNDRDVKNKILIGKRDFEGVDIFSTTMSNSDSDIIIYNTKKDSVSNNKTKISILSGTNSTYNNTAPFIQSQILSTQSVSFDIENPNGDINVKSLYDTISINNLPLTQSNPNDGQCLGYNDGNLTWNDITQEFGSIGSTNSQTNVYGADILINGTSFFFTDNREIVNPIGDINIGDTFTNISIVEVLRRMLYDYIIPSVELTLNSPYTSGYIERGDSPNVTLKYKIIKNTKPTQSIVFNNCLNPNIPNITTNGQQVIEGNVNGIVSSPAIGTTNFKLTVTDVDGGYDVSDAYINAIYPYFVGVYNDANTSVVLQNINKLIEPIGDKEIVLNGYGFIYFMYDSSYPNLSDILNDSGVSVLSDFYLSVISISAPNGLWQSKTFKIYRSNTQINIGIPGDNYKFKY